MKPPPPIEELLPHRYGMLLVERLLEWDASSAAVSASPSADGWYAEDGGGMPSRIGIELMAQAIASHVSVVAWSKGEPPKKGVLLGARAYRATQPHFPAGSKLTVTAVKAFSDESGMGAYDTRIELEGAEVAKARILVFEPPDFEAFIAAQR